jgi:hypothetical protein
LAGQTAGPRAARALAAGARVADTLGAHLTVRAASRERRRDALAVEAAPLALGRALARADRRHAGLVRAHPTIFDRTARRTSVAVVCAAVVAGFTVGDDAVGAAEHDLERDDLSLDQERLASARRHDLRAVHPFDARDERLARERCGDDHDDRLGRRDRARVVRHERGPVHHARVEALAFDHPGDREPIEIEPGVRHLDAHSGEALLDRRRARAEQESERGDPARPHRQSTTPSDPLGS